MRLLLALLLGVPAVALSAPAPAHACDCQEGSPGKFLEWADAVFVATLLEPLQEGSPGTAEARAALTTVYDGTVPDEVTIVTALEGVSCGITGMAVGETWLFYGSVRDEDVVGVTACGGSARASDDQVERIERLLGPGRAFEPAPGPDPAPVEPRSAPEGDGVAARALVLGGAGAVLLLTSGGAVLLRRGGGRLW